MNIIANIDVFPSVKNKPIHYVIY